MKTGLIVSFLASVCLLSAVQAQCNIKDGTYDVPFPDILKYSANSYIMGVEYSVPGAKQTDYYTEYYEYEFKRGRLDGHQKGTKFQYVYNAETFEAWNIDDNKCELVNITVTPDFMKDDMTDWFHSSGTEQFTTVGPSAMFKVALDKWNNQFKEKTKTMAYMGISNLTVRGEKSQYFRRCLGQNSFVDYHFAADEEENAFDDDEFNKNVTPLRVAFYSMDGKEEEMSFQFYDIISFRHEIPVGMEPFQLPKGKDCTRGSLAEGPKMPDYSENNLMISAEVIYQKISTKDDERELMSSYYSTLMLAIDREIEHIAYFFSSWNTTKPDKDHQEPFVNAPKFTVFDMNHFYTYQLNYENTRCSIAREKSFNPSYRLPENGGSVALMSPYVFFPNDEFSYLTTATERGLKVNIFEAKAENYPLDMVTETIVDKLLVSRSYLTDNEEIENSVAVKSPLTQVELHLFRKKDIEEILTFNIFGFTTRIPRGMKVFDITQCFKNEDDYLYLTLGFEPEPRHLPVLAEKLPEIERSVIGAITTHSELNAVRIPYVMTDIKNDFILMTMMILGKPPLILDFTDAEANKTVTVASDDDIQGVSTFDVCANNCLETQSGCWGFSMCGSTCYYGSENSKVVEKKNCTLYKRYTNNTYIQSKDVQANNIVSQVEAGELMTMVILDNGDQVQLKASIAQITNPAEDDDLFQKMGNLLNPRMRVHKSATKLKKGTAIKNLGKLRYDECQKLCLDFKDCETVSYCLINSECQITGKFAVDLKAEDMQEDYTCNLLARKYADHFDRTPGVFGSLTGGTTVAASSVENCARECLKTDKFKCLSFDHCGGGERDGCRLYTTHYLKSGSGVPPEGKSPRCGHYNRKYSTEFKKKEYTRVEGGNFETILNITLEDCAHRCIDYAGGRCFGYDFCQDREMYATSCTLLDSDPSKLKTVYNPICSNYGRTGAEYAPRPYSTGYAGGIGVLCFLVGGAVGALIVFAIAYRRMNKGS